MLFNELGALNISGFAVPEAQAQGTIAQKTLQSVSKSVSQLLLPTSHSELGIVAILVENSLLDDKTAYTTNGSSSTLREDIFAYAENVQKRMPHTRAIVLGVDPNESSFKISTILEKLYYEGANNKFLNSDKQSDLSPRADDNRLIGVVLVGNVPVPVVYPADGNAIPSLYPYTDFDQKRYVYNHNSGHFEENTNALNPTPDIWHGVIVPPSKDDAKRRQEFADYFYKNNQYSNKLNGYADFNKRMLYYNFPEVEKKLNTLDYNNYKRFIKYIEEIAYRRFNRNLLQQIIQEVSADTEPDKPAEERTPIIDDQSIANMMGNGIELMIKKYTANFAYGLKTYLGRLNSTIAGTGRWSEKEYDSLASLITLRDTYMQTMLTAKSIELEKLINREIQNVEENVNLINGINVNVSMCNLSGLSCTTTSFNFRAFTKGTKIDNLSSVAQCGLQRGQLRPSGVSVAENNSVLVEANSTYDPDTAIIPPEGDDTKLTDRSEYKGYAGCVANNAIQIDIDDQDIHLGPGYCKPDEAYAPVFDIAGAKELAFTPYKPSDPRPLDIFILPAEQCKIDYLSFLQNPSPYPGFLGGTSHYIFNDGAYTPSALYPTRPLSTAVNSTYSGMVAIGEISSETAVSDTVPQAKLTTIARKILKLAMSGTRTYYDAGKLIKFSVTATTRPVNSVYSHVEPTDQTISTTCKSQITQSVPSDGIRFVEFYKNGTRQVYKYPDLFRVAGNNASEITTNIVAMVRQKDAELNELLGAQKNIVTQFFINNSSLIEPILWRQLSIDQKHQLILEKYLNRDSFLPVPNPNASPPTSKPKGYEVLHIYADGDAQEFKFGINNSRLSESALADPELDEAKKTLEDEEKNTVVTETPATEEGGTEGEELFTCGDPNGVEIWEWLPNLIGCWIPEEITNLGNMVKLDSSCTGGGIPEPKTEPQENILDVLENSSLTIDNPDNKPAKLDVTIDKKTLVQGEEALIKVKVLNDKDKTIVGYIEDPLTLSATNSEMAGFDQSSVEVYTGEATAKLTAGNKSGQTTITIKLGSLTNTFQIKVVDGIKIKLTYEKETGKPSYKITANLVDLSDKPVTDVNTEISLSPLNPSDGKFVKNLTDIQNGTGETTFYPNPEGTNIQVTATHPVYTSDILTVPPIINDPFKIVINAPSELSVGENADIPVEVTDIYGVLSKDFSDTINVKVTDKTKDFGSLVSEDVIITNGQGVIKLKVGKETGKLNLIATFSNLAPGNASIQIVAKITQEDWSRTFPQNLFASFVGFPAADFLKEGYFGGTHLFNGKTEAVFGFMSDIPPTPILTVMPNYQIKSSGVTQITEITNHNNSLGLQIYDDKILKLQLSTTIPIDFESVAMWDENIKPSEGTIYFKTTNENYNAELKDGVINIFNTDQEKVSSISKNNIVFQKMDNTLSLETESDYDLLELILSNPDEEIGRLYLNYKPRELDPANFKTDSAYKFQTLYTGSSINDPTGLILYDPSVAPDESKKPAENFGFESDNKYILRFAGGSPIGEAVMWNLPPNAVLLGDPTITLENNSNSSLNYDNTIGRQIYQDAKGSDIVALTNFDFNNDKIQDVAAVMKDGRIRFFEGGNTNPQYIDRGDIAFLADGALNVASFDFKKDGYEDLVVATKEGRLAILNNDKEVITRTDQKLKVGKELYQITKADMDMDGNFDLVTLDSRGDIRIFYGKNNQIPENGVLLGNYGFSIALGQNLKSDLQIRYPGMPEPQGITSYTTGATTGATTGPYDLPVITPPEEPDFSALQSFPTRDTSRDVSESEAAALMSSLDAATQNAIAGNAPATVPKLPWNEGDQTEAYFGPMTDFETNNPSVNGGLIITATKTVENADRPKAKDLDLGENLKYTINLTANRDVNNFVLVDIVPDALELDQESITCEGVGCFSDKPKVNGVYIFMSGLNLRAGKQVKITYKATVKHTPKAVTMIQKLDGKTKLNARIPYDNYKDVLVSPPYNDTGQLIAYYTIAPRSYKITTTVKEENQIVSDAVAQNASCIDELNKLKNLSADENMDPSFMDKVMEKCGLDKVQEDMKQCKIDPSGAPVAPTPEECALNPDSCAESALNDMLDTLRNFACMGGGCFPMPYNMAFLAPNSIPFAMPILAFPATLPTPVGPIPVPSFFASAPTGIGAATIPGPIMSSVRLYTMPTLTGGIGIAFCWGPYTGNAPVPPPLIPIPYPPPTGNCMTFAIPMSNMPQCKIIEKGITALIEAANNVVSDINSGVSAVNNSGLPIEIQQKSQPQGQNAGGLEVGLAINLGQSMKFQPPTKSFSNKHLSTYDSVMGKLSGWWDRQQLEILNKLLTLPTLRIILPDIPSIFASDWYEFNKTTTAWWNYVSGKSAKDASALPEPFSQTTSSVTSPTDAGTSFLDEYKTLEKNISAFNTSAIEGLYQIINSIPFIKLNEHRIDFKIPYISYAQIQDVIRDFEQAKVYYQKQVNKYRDLIAKYRCPDPTKSTADCAMYKILSMIIVDVDKLINSIVENVKVLQSYLAFPRNVVLLKKQLASYLSQIACIMESFSTMIGGWLKTIQSQIIGYVEVYYTIIEIVKNIKKLFNIFTNFEDNCDICTNDRFSNFGWYTLLGLVIPDIPIIKFPKWPDIVLDLSNLKSSITIEMPLIHFIGQPIKLPRIPRIPFPDIPDLSFALQIPALPILPRLPDLPKLPPLPAVPAIKLPTLPPPPKLPDVGAQFKIIMELLQMLLNIWCLIKKAFAPIPEAYLKDHTVLLTNRPAYLIPLDLLQIRLADIALIDTGFNELDITTKVYLGVRLKMVWDKLQSAADEWNKRIPTDWSDLFDKAAQAAFGDMLNKLANLSDWITKALGSAAITIEQGWAKNVQGKLNEWNTDIQKIDQQYFRSAEAKMQDAFDLATKVMGDATKEANQKMANNFAEFKKWADEMNDNLSITLRKAASNTYFKWMNAYLTGGLSVAIDQMKDTDIREWFQQNILDEISTAWSTAVIEGTFKQEDCEKEFSKWSAEEQWLQDIINEAKKKNCAQTQASAQPSKLIASQTQESISPEIKKTFTDTFAKLTTVIEDINKKAPVDYKVLKKEYNIPNYKLSAKPSALDKIEKARQKVLAQSKQLEDEVNESTNSSDLYAWVQNQLDTSSENIVAKTNVSETAVASLPSNSSTSNLLAQVPSPPRSSSQQSASSGTSSSVCTGTCLVDPKTGQSVQFIPYLDNPATSQTAFIPTTVTGKSNVVYSDGPNLYLKRDLSVPLNITTNIASHVPNIIFALNDFITAGTTVLPPKEAINMLTTTLTEDSTASFNWMENTNPDQYGVGIELERSILGFDADKQNNGLADVTAVLLPLNADGTTPRVTVGDKVVDYGTLITSYTDQTEARKVFGIEPKTMMTGADKVLFRTIGNGKQSMGITLRPTRAVYFDLYSGSGYSMNMDNGYYHIKMTWFDRYGNVANYNHSELLAPQIYINSAPPIDTLLAKDFKFPIYKEAKINAGEVLTDLTGSYKYYWDMNQDGLSDSVGSQLVIPPQKEPKEFNIDLVASINPGDSSFKQYKKQIKVIIYVPDISLEEIPLKDNGEAKGTMKPLEPKHDLSDMPFSIFRKRWGIWKNLGLLKQRRNTPTTPPLSDKNTFKNNYYSIDSGGDYLVQGFSSGPSNVLITDQTPKDIARVHIGTGQIEMLDNNYEIKVIPASWILPTRASILKKGFDTVLSNVYYVADSNTDAVILDEPITQANLPNIGVELGDLNTSDSIIAKNMPGFTESFPGGAAIFNKNTQKNIALVDSSGAIRMMSTGYSLQFKNQGKLDEKVIFQLVDSAKKPVFDIFIATDFNNLVIKQDEIWNDIKVQIGYLKKKIQPMFASLIAQNDATVKKPGIAKSPFSDVDPSNPNYKAIIDLYTKRIISGYSDGTFKPDAKISRAEFVKIALGATNCFDCSKPTDSQRKGYTGFKPFPDVDMPDWFFFCVSIGKALKMVTGYGDGYFRPAKNISRAEAAAVLIRQAEIEIRKSPDDYFLDVPNDAWYKDYVYTAVQIGLIKESTGFVFPDEEITRGEFAFMAVTVLEVKDCRTVDSDKDGMPDWWEMENNLNPLDLADAQLDPDEDNFTNLQEYKNGTNPNVFNPPAELCFYINNPNQNDTDLDGIIDVCDDDIDNDGIKNVLGIYDENGLIDSTKVAESKDNCVFIANADQTDSNNNGIGDTCEALHVDLCPEIPEDLDAYHDDDGCPELNDAIFEKKATQEGKKPPKTVNDYYKQTPGVYVNKGPACYFLDYENDFVKDDIIMTAITDVVTHDTIYSQSNEVTY